MKQEPQRGPLDCQQGSLQHFYLSPDIPYQGMQRARGLAARRGDPC